MTALIITAILILLTVIVVQIGKVTELAAKIRGEEDVQESQNKRQGGYLMLFMVGFLVFSIGSAIYYKNYMLGYGPHEAASAHGTSLDYIFNVTLFFTGIVFVITQILLFYFAYKYKSVKGRKASFIVHDNRLEVVWTLIPAIVMTFLVVGGLDVWNEVMSDVSEDDISVLVPEAENEYLEIEGTGYQFAWHLRYPGADGKLGTRDYKQISGTNPLGQVWTDKKNMDDFHPSEIVLPVGKKVRVRITARDVLHNFYLPHFRVKMDAIPGLPTHFVFTPEKTTEEYRQSLREYPEYQVADPDDPEKQLWETFDYELACAELCGAGHFSMRRVVKVVSMEEYKAWLEGQQSYYMSTIRGSDADPFKDELLDVEVKERKQEFNDALDKALSATEVDEKTIQFNYVNFETGSADLTPLSKYELDNLVEAMNKYENMTLSLAGHTDDTGDEQKNMELSTLRAQTVRDYLTSKGIDESRLTYVGYGSSRPIETNDTEEGRKQNRRTEFTILTQ